MGSSYCCISHETTEELIFKDFWNLKLRTKTQKDLIEFMQKKVLQEITFDIINCGFELVISDYLLPIKNNWKSFYLSFWLRKWKEALNLKCGTYYMYTSLLLLAINNKVEFTNSVVQLNLMFPNSISAFKSADFLDFYFKLITFDCLKEVAQINELDQENLEKLMNIYGEQTRNLLISKVLKESEYLDNYLFVVENYSFLSDDVFIRDSFKLNSDKSLK